VNDSELVARQLTGEYRVKSADLRPLHERALDALRRLDRWSVRSVPRLENDVADALVNEAIDARRATVGQVRL
jgi:ribonuclease HI